MSEPQKQQPDGEPNSAQQPPSCGEEVVDVTLIRWMLSLTPAERVKVLEDNIHALTRLRNAKRTSEHPSDPSDTDEA
jgi:hypothetical protein